MRALCAWFAALVLASPLPAEVKVGLRSDGLKLIFNEAPEHRARREAAALLPVPVRDWAPVIDYYARRHHVEPKLVRAMIQVESGYNPRALSHKGAMGLMQLMPETAQELAVEDPYDPFENIRGGTTYLRRLLDRFRQRLELALAAYNAGPGAVDRHSGIPPYDETRDYVRRVLRLYRGRDAAVAASGAVRGRPPVVLRHGGRILITTDPPDQR
jgi:soluble lytic murein transglycosylase-like protein